MREIPLTQGKIAQVDDEDFERLSQWKWQASVLTGGLCYARRGESRGGVERKIYMHHEVLGVPSSTEVDHANGNGVDNRKDNLRLGTHAQNLRNTGLRTNNTSGYKGVHYDSARGKWKAEICVRGKGHHLGRFPTAEEAARAYDAAARAHSGEFAWLNFPDES
jgi:hypothetical protein